MPQNIQLRLTPEQAKNEEFIKLKLKEMIKGDFAYKWRKRSIDARKKQIWINASFDIYSREQDIPQSRIFNPSKVDESKKVAIIGCGPAGMFAALESIELGIKPIIFERGKDVRARRRDLARLNKEGLVNPESNYCFGEGGAGTYSDGKLYTRSKKRGDVQKVLEWFVHFGANEDILVDAHPHIGTNKLPQIIIEMREAILKHGGEIHFDSKLTDIFTENGHLTGIEINGSQNYDFDSLILATGHSARDIYTIINDHGWSLEAKPFALGVRVEHPQYEIDKIQYHGRVNDEFLPPASYSLVTQVNGRGVYSFCMCPGGIVAPCATADGEVVTNGWSPSKRNNPFANSGIVVSLDPSDFKDEGPLTCLNFQKDVEQRCWEAGGKNQKVPAQRLRDFIEGKISKDLPTSSYQPGLTSVDLNKLLPRIIVDNLKMAFLDFDNKLKHFVTNDAILHAPESRTSSPVKIPRDTELQHPDVRGLFPCAEGAGYAGGIVSAAIDGIACARKVKETLNV